MESEYCSNYEFCSVQLWTPPTPPQDDNDIYIDSVMCLMYDTTPIPESKLPPVYVRKERKRHKTDPSGKCLFKLVLRFNPEKFKKNYRIFHTCYVSGPEFAGLKR